MLEKTYPPQKQSPLGVGFFQPPKAQARAEVTELLADRKRREAASAEAAAASAAATSRFSESLEMERDRVSRAQVRRGGGEGGESEIFSTHSKHFCIVSVVCYPSIHPSILPFVQGMWRCSST